MKVFWSSDINLFSPTIITLDYLKITIVYTLFVVKFRTNFPGPCAQGVYVNKSFVTSLVRRSNVSSASRLTATFPLGYTLHSRLCRSSTFFKGTGVHRGVRRQGSIAGYCVPITQAVTVPCSLFLPIFVYMISLPYLCLQLGPEVESSTHSGF